MAVFQFYDVLQRAKYALGLKGSSKILANAGLTAWVIKSN